MSNTDLDLLHLQYKMFLLNRFGRNNLGQFDIFTIQNVPIKSTENNRYLFKNLDLQYKMFLLNDKSK